MMPADRRDYRALAALPIEEVTDDELAQLHSILNGRIAGLPRLLPDLSNEAFERAMEQERLAEEPRQMQAFLEGQAATACAVRCLLADRGFTAADQVIAFIAEGGLETDAWLAMTVRREYANFLEREGVWPGRVVEQLLAYYAQLEPVLLERRAA